jgi:hypothetical protein
MRRRESLAANLTKAFIDVVTVNNLGQLGSIDPELFEEKNDSKSRCQGLSDTVLIIV